MSISCGCDTDDFAWFYKAPSDFSSLSTKRSRRCCSCGCSLKHGDTVAEFERHRHPRDEIEERIWSDNDIPMASWFMCEACGGLFMALEENGFCITLRKGENMRDLVKQSKGESW